MTQPASYGYLKTRLKRRKTRGAARQYRPLVLERLERRDMFAVEPISLADPSFSGDSVLGNPAGGGTLQRGNDVSMSADGQIVAFESRANNLVARDLNRFEDVFFYDRGTGQVQLVSAKALGDPANNRSFNPRVTPDGRFTFFNSEAKDLDPTINVTVNGAQVYRS